MAWKRLFGVVWIVMYVLYLTGIGVYGYAVDGVVGSALLGYLTRPSVLVGAFLISLLMTIPIFQFMLGARSRAYRREQVRPNSDPFILPADVEAGDEKTARLKILDRENTLSIRLWMLFVVLMSFIGLYVLFHLHQTTLTVRTQVLERDVVEMVEIPGELVPLRLPESYSDKPKYHGLAKTSEQVQADRAYVASMLDAYGSVDSALTVELARGWQAFSERDSVTALSAFNRAWLLSATSSSALHGMGLVEAVRGNFPESVVLFREALMYDPGQVTYHCDIALSYYNMSVVDGADVAGLLAEADSALRVVRDAEHMSPACVRTEERVRERYAQWSLDAGDDGESVSLPDTTTEDE